MIHLFQKYDADWLGTYREANVMVGAESPSKAVASYSTYIFIASDVKVSHGREIHVQPK